MTVEDRARRAARNLRRATVTDAPPIEQVRRRKTRRRVAAAGTAAVLLAGAVAWSVGDDGGAPVVAGPGETEPTAGPTASPQTGTADSKNPRPTSFLGLREDGTLVMVRDGVLAEIANRGDPRQKPTEGGPYFIASVAWDEMQEFAYYEFCCEPAGGAIVRTVLRTGAEELVADGYHPALGARRLVFSTYGGVAIIDLDSGERHDIEGGEGYEPGSGVVAVSPDGRTIAMEDASGPDRRSRILVFDAQATSLDEATALEPPDGHSWSQPVFRADGMLLVAQQCCWPEPEGAAVGLVLDPAHGGQLDRFQYEGPVLDQSYDATGTWLIYVTSDHVLRWRGAGGTGTLGQGYLSADW